MTTPINLADPLVAARTWRFKFEFTDPLDITGYQLHFILKLKADDPDNLALVDISTTAGDDPGDDPVNGLAYLTALPDLTGIAPGRYVYAFDRLLAGAPPDTQTLQYGEASVVNAINTLP